MKIALVHDWLTGLRGGEKVLDTLLALYPMADVYTLVHVPGTTTKRIDARVRGVSWLGRLPGVRFYYRALLPLFPFAARALPLDGYDVVISVSHAAAKNVHLREGTLHICYCLTPMRYIWDQAASYLGHLRFVAWPLISLLRRWDRRGADRVDWFIAISHFVAARIRCFYGRGACVVYPGVDVRSCRVAPAGTRGAFFLSAGALVPYKRVDLAIQACLQAGERLVVVGDGPERENLRRLAGGSPLIEFRGRVSDEELRGLYRECRALLFPGTEDFGMVPIECLASGRPVIASFSGGAKETITALKHWESPPATSVKPTGVFIRAADGDIHNLIDALDFFGKRENEFSPEACRSQAERFSVESFVAEWRGFVHALAAKSVPKQTLIAALYALTVEALPEKEKGVVAC